MRTVWVGEEWWQVSAAAAAAAAVLVRSNRLRTQEDCTARMQGASALTKLIVNTCTRTHGQGDKETSRAHTHAHAHAKIVHTHTPVHTILYSVSFICTLMAQVKS